MDMKRFLEIDKSIDNKMLWSLYKLQDISHMKNGICQVTNDLHTTTTVVAAVQFMSPQH